MDAHANVELVAAARADPQTRLHEAARGLLYTSEADYPFEPFSVAAPGAPRLLPDEFAALMGRAGERAEEITLDEFFARHIERVHPADEQSMRLVPRYQALKENIRATFPAVRVFRIGSTSRIDCFVVGQLPGGIGGLRTVSIET